MEEPPGLPLLAFWVAPRFLNVEIRLPGVATPDASQLSRRATCFVNTGTYCPTAIKLPGEVIRALSGQVASTLSCGPHDSGRSTRLQITFYPASS